MERLTETKQAGQGAVEDLVRSARELMRRFDTDGYEEAVPLLREAIEIKPVHAPAYAALSQIYAYWGFRREIVGLEAQSLYDMAHEYADIALRLAPERSDAHRAMAISLRRGRLADPARRRQEAKIALDLDPADAENWCELWRVDGYEPDAPAVRKALALDPGLCEVYIDLGAVYSELGLYDRAIEQLTKALKINPRNALAYYDLAMTLDRKGLRPAAAELLRKALQLKPADSLLEIGLELVEGSGG